MLLTPLSPNGPISAEAIAYQMQSLKDPLYPEFLKLQPTGTTRVNRQGVTIEKLAPIRAEMLRLSADPAFVDSVLADGAEKARAMARPNMDAIKDILGLVH